MTVIFHDSSKRMKLNLAKLVEMRKRSRIERARQLADNIETQTHILKSIELYNLEAEKRRLEVAIGNIGQHVPAVGRAMAETRLNLVRQKEPKLQHETAFSIARPTVRRKLLPAVDVGPLDQFMVRQP